MKTQTRWVRSIRKAAKSLPQPRCRVFLFRSTPVLRSTTKKLVLGSNRHPLRAWRPAILSGLLALPSAGQSAPAASDLCIYQGYTDKELARYTPDLTGSFSLSFVHSVSLTPVVDHYEIRPSGIHQTAEVFEAHGAGLPSFAGDVGTTGWHRRDGKFVLTMDRKFPRIQLRIQRTYFNTLHIADQDITLADFGTNSIGLKICEAGGD